MHGTYGNKQHGAHWCSVDAGAPQWKCESDKRKEPNGKGPLVTWADGETTAVPVGTARNVDMRPTERRVAPPYGYGASDGYRATTEAGSMQAAKPRTTTPTPRATWCSAARASGATEDDTTPQPKRLASASEDDDKDQRISDLTAEVNRLTLENKRLNDAWDKCNKRRLGAEMELFGLKHKDRHGVDNDVMDKKLPNGASVVQQTKDNGLGATHGSAPPTATLLAGTTNGIRGQLGAAAATPPKEGASAHMQQTDTPPKEGASALHENRHLPGAAAATPPKEGASALPKKKPMIKRNAKGNRPPQGVKEDDPLWTAAYRASVKNYDDGFGSEGRKMEGYSTMVHNLAIKIYRSRKKRKKFRERKRTQTQSADGDLNGANRHGGDAQMQIKKLAQETNEKTAEQLEKQRQRNRERNEVQLYEGSVLGTGMVYYADRKHQGRLIKWAESRKHGLTLDRMKNKLCKDEIEIKFR